MQRTGGARLRPIACGGGWLGLPVGDESAGPRVKGTYVKRERRAQESRKEIVNQGKRRKKEG